MCVPGTGNSGQTRSIGLELQSLAGSWAKEGLQKQIDVEFGHVSLARVLLGGGL